MKIEVELSSVFQTAFKKSRLYVELRKEETTVIGLLRCLSKANEGKVDFLLFEKGGELILPGLMVMVNDKIFTGTVLNKKVIRLQNSDKVRLMYFVSGG